MLRDDQAFGLYTGWYNLAAERGEWIQLISDAIVARCLRLETTAKSVCCAICERLFASERGLRRHKFREERLKTIHEQAGAVLCETFHRWFASRGEFAVHSCSPSFGDAPVPEIVAPRPPDCSQCQYHCHTCDRCFQRKAGHRQHNCNRRTCSSGSERRTIPCPTCSRKFTSPVPGSTQMQEVTLPSLPP